MSETMPLRKMSLTYSQFSDVDDYIDSISSWDAHISQLVSGRSQSSQLSVSVSNYGYLFLSHTLKSIHKSIQAEPGFTFMIPMAGETASFVDQKTTAPVIRCVPFGEAVTFITPDDFSGVTVNISNDEMHRLLGYRYDHSQHYGRGLYYPSAIQLRQLQIWLLEIKAHFDGVDIITQCKAEWLRVISENKVAPLLLSIFGNQCDQSTKQRPKTFLSALSMIGDNIDSPPSINELSENLGISPRNLQYLFRNHLGVTPKHLIKAVRLNTARRRLRHSQLSHGVISDIANGLGYWHMGSFSHDFKKLFQLSPSDLLKENYESALDANNKNSKKSVG